MCERHLLRGSLNHIYTLSECFRLVHPSQTVEATIFFSKLLEVREDILETPLSPSPSALASPSSPRGKRFQG